LLGHHWQVSSIQSFPDEKLLNASGSVRLVDNLCRFEVIGEETNKDGHVLVGDLVPEHVHKLDARCLELGKCVDVGALGHLQLGDNQLLKVVEQHLVLNEQFGGTMLVGVARDACRNQQVQ